MTYCGKPQDFAENLALNRTIGFLGTEIPSGVSKKYLSFWSANKDLYINMTGAEKVAVLRSYPSMAYNNMETQVAVNMAEQALQQRQIPFDIIFDQQLGKLKKYSVIVLADQESLTDETVVILKKFVREGGGIVLTGNTGTFDGWRRLRKVSFRKELFYERESLSAKKPGEGTDPASFDYGKGRVIYLPSLIQPQGEVKLGMESVWRMPENANEFISAIYGAAMKPLPLKVTAPEWIGVSHDTRENREIIHLFNYKNSPCKEGITLEFIGKVKNAWAVSPDFEGKKTLPIVNDGVLTKLSINDLDVYDIIVLEK
jgi:hypothetical protein